MSSAEEFIRDYTRNCSNEIIRNNNDSFTNIPKKGEYCPWLTPDQARKAVEIAREEIYEWLKEHVYIYSDDLYLEGLIRDLKQAMKDE